MISIKQHNTKPHQTIRFQGQSETAASNIASLLSLDIKPDNIDSGTIVDHMSDKSGMSLSEINKGIDNLRAVLENVNIAVQLKMLVPKIKSAYTVYNDKLKERDKGFTCGPSTVYTVKPGKNNTIVITSAECVAHTAYVFTLEKSGNVSVACQSISDKTNISPSRFDMEKLRELKRSLDAVSEFISQNQIVTITSNSIS